MAVDYQTNPAVLNKSVILMREHIITDVLGAPESKWHPIAQVMAAIEPLTGREYWQAAQAQGESTVKIIMRYRDGITDRMRIKYNNIIYEMKSPPINELMQNKFLILMCREMSRNDSIEEQS